MALTNNDTYRFVKKKLIFIKKLIDMLKSINVEDSSNSSLLKNNTLRRKNKVVKHFKVVRRLDHIYTKINVRSGKRILWRKAEACSRAAIELTPFIKLLSHYAGSRLKYITSCFLFDLFKTTYRSSSPFLSSSFFFFIFHRRGFLVCD